MAKVIKIKKGIVNCPFCNEEVFNPYSDRKSQFIYSDCKHTLGHYDDDTIKSRFGFSDFDEYFNSDAILRVIIEDRYNESIPKKEFKKIVRQLSVLKKITIKNPKGFTFQDILKWIIESTEDLRIKYINKNIFPKDFLVNSTTFIFIKKSKKIERIFKDLDMLANQLSNYESTILCPFCKKTVYSDDTNFTGECEHYLDVFDGRVEWGELDNNLSVIGDIINILNEYVGENTYEKKMGELLSGLKLKKHLNSIFDLYDDVEQILESITDQIYCHIEPAKDTGSMITFTPNLLFLNDESKIQWILDDLVIILERLISFDSNHKKTYICF